MVSACYFSRYRPLRKLRWVVALIQVLLQHPGGLLHGLCDKKWHKQGVVVSRQSISPMMYADHG